jgi:hypothetical protein
MSIEWLGVPTITQPDGTTGKADLQSLTDALMERINGVRDGNMACAESMLVAQAHTLDAAFHMLLRVAEGNLIDHFDGAERVMRLALRAQNQARATLETLSTVKNPPHPATFVRQQNIAHGAQQVNNGVPTLLASAPAREQDGPPKLLEQQHEQWLDTRAAATPGAVDPAVATVGEVNGTSDRGR